MAHDHFSRRAWLAREARTFKAAAAKAENALDAKALRQVAGILLSARCLCHDGTWSPPTAKTEELIRARFRALGDLGQSDSIRLAPFAVATWMNSRW